MVHRSTKDDRNNNNLVRNGINQEEASEMVSAGSEKFVGKHAFG